MFLRRRIAPNVDGFRIGRLASVSAEPVRRASIGQFDVVQSRNVRSGIGQSVVSQNTLGLTPFGGHTVRRLVPSD